MKNTLTAKIVLVITIAAGVPLTIEGYKQGYAEAVTVERAEIGIDIVNAAPPAEPEIIEDQGSETPESSQGDEFLE